MARGSGLAEILRASSSDALRMTARSVVSSFLCSELSAVDCHLLLCNRRLPRPGRGVASPLFSKPLAVNSCPISTLDLNMKTKKPNAELVWKQMEDDVVPRLR